MKLKDKKIDILYADHEPDEFPLHCPHRKAQDKRYIYSHDERSYHLKRTFYSSCSFKMFFIA